MFNRFVERLILGALLFVSIIAIATPAQAHKRNFAWSYEWFTPYMDEKEIEIWSTSSDNGNNWDLQLEYEFAVNPRHGMGLYLLFENRLPEALVYEGWKWENRYRFGEFDHNRWLHAVYSEIKKEESEPYELEAKWLLTKYSKNGDAFAFNLVTEKELASDTNFEWAYTTGWSHRLNERVRTGVESFGEFDDDEHYLGINLTYDFSRSKRIVLGAAAGLNPRSDDLVLRTVMEFE